MLYQPPLVHVTSLRASLGNTPSYLVLFVTRLASLVPTQEIAFLFPFSQKWRCVWWLPLHHHLVTTLLLKGHRPKLGYPCVLTALLLTNELIQYGNRYLTSTTILGSSERNTNRNLFIAYGLAKNGKG